ncbi:MAG: O-antigen ligase family protein [Patescibacteria group bacterium]
MIDQIIQFFYSLLFFVTPILMSKSTSELFEFNKMLFIYVITIFIAFFWLLKMVVNNKIILKKTFLDIPIIVFFLSQLISTIVSIDKHTSIFGYYGRFNGGLLSTVSYIILYFAFVSNKINVEKTLKAILTSSLLVIFWAIPGKLGHDLTCLLFTGQFNNSCWDNSTLAFRPELRAFSTLGQPNWLGAYLAVTFFIGIYFYISQKSKVKSQNLNSKLKSLLWLIYLFFNFSMILFSRSRSALLSVLIGLILFTGYYVFFIKTNIKKFLLILLIVTAVPILLFKTGIDKTDKYLTLKTYQNIFIKKPASLPTTNYKLPTTNSSSVTESFDIRKIVWQGAWELGLKYPLFGTGVETFAYSYNLVRPVAHNLTSEWDYVYNKAHNEYFNFLATTGFIGLGSYLLVIIIFIIYLIKKLRITNVCLLIAYLTILITNFFGFSTTTIQLFFFLIPAFIFSSFDFQPPTTYPLPPNKLTNLQKFIIFLLLSSTIYLLFSISVYYLADVNYSYGTKYIKIGDQQKAAVYLEKAIKLRKEPVYEDRFSSSLSYLAALSTLQNQKDLAKQIADISDTYNRKLVQAYPKNVFYWKTRAKNMYYFYQVTGNENELLQGIEALKTAQKLSPTDPKIPYSLALYYATLFDSTKKNLERDEWRKLSIEGIEKSIKLKSNYQEAYLFKEELLKKYNLYKDGP